MIELYIPIARAILGLRKLKIITFGPRPQDFFACNAPIKGLYVTCNLLVGPVIQLGGFIERRDPFLSPFFVPIHVNWN